MKLLSQQKKNQNRIAIYIFCVFVIFCFVYAFFVNNDLQKNGIIVSGKIVSDVFSAKSSVMKFRYEFVHQGKLHIGDSPAGVTNSKEFIGKVFPVRVSTKSGKNEILLTPRDFKKYELDYPDSLEWVRKYLISK